MVSLSNLTGSFISKTGLLAAGLHIVELTNKGMNLVDGSRV